MESKNPAVMWRAPARKAYPLLIAAGSCHLIALILLFVSAAVGWISLSAAFGDVGQIGLNSYTGGVEASLGAVTMTATGTACNWTIYGYYCYNASTSTVSIAVPGAAIWLFGTLFTFIAMIISFVAAARLRAVAQGGAAPPAPEVSGCGCYASIPAINGTGWTGFALIAIGLAVATGILSVVGLIQGITFTVIAGGPIGAVGLFFSLIGCVLGAVAGCSTKGMPGIGEGACCCVAGTSGNGITTSVASGVVAPSSQTPTHTTFAGAPKSPDAKSSPASSPSSTEHVV